MAREDRYVFDKTRMEFRQVTRSVWTVFGKILKYFLVTASLAVVYYVIFSLVVNTDSERKLKRDIQTYESLYGEMLRKEELIGDVLEGLKEKDSEIYRQLFNSDSPDLGVIYPEGMLSVIDSVGDKDIVEYVGRKLDLLEAASSRVEENLLRVTAALDSGGVKSLPPLTNPLGEFSYARTGASVGRKINPFYKVPASHGGLDLISQRGEPVYASAAGTVKSVEHSSKGLGNVVEIAHEGGFVTRYAHLENTRVSKGQKVEKGQRIGQVGMSGNSFAPHLHYEVMRDTVRLDPLNFMFASVTPEEYMGMLFMSFNTGQSMD
ncbi:MAG: M23 family metallopeptidase [Bacteroidales bacterium]|nr:M23 family metallopeptidase [Bacteroidales bacterium]